MSAATIIKPAVPAATFTFDPDAHLYTLNGALLPSVTQVLEDVGIIDYSGIPPTIREHALARGSRVHLATAFDDEFFIGASPDPLDEDSIADEDRGYVDAWRRFRQEKGFRPELIEYRSYEPRYMFAGTLDRTGYFKSNPAQKVLADIKTGTAAKWTALQTAAYAACFKDPRTYLRLCIELHEDATYRLFPYQGREFADHFNEFIVALSCMRLRKKYGN